MLCLGILINDKIIRFSGYIWAAIFVFNIPGTDTTMILYMTAAIITCAVLGLIALVRTYHWTDKYLLTFLAMIYTWGFLYTLDELLYATSCSYKYSPIFPQGLILRSISAIPILTVV